eukprot:13210140-Alexandrium_andersonii.AAC.1
MAAQAAAVGSLQWERKTRCVCVCARMLGIDRCDSLRLRRPFKKCTARHAHFLLVSCCCQ